MTNPHKNRCSPLRRLARRWIPVRWHPTFLLKQRLEQRVSGCRITTGPFLGMKLDHDAVELPLFSRIGVYECELHPLFERWRSVPFGTILTGGAGYGYYAVGMARHWPRARLIGWEMDAGQRGRCETLARINEVASRVELRGEWTITEMATASAAADQPFLVLMDVEGAERDLLDPALAPALRNAHIIVEIHDFIDRGIGSLLGERFEESHAIEEIWQHVHRGSEGVEWPRPRWLRHLLFRRAYDNLLGENRPERMRWFAMTPVSSVCGA